LRQKELRIALICYGGISLAVYMHGVTKELWKVLRASRTFWSGHDAAAIAGSEAVYVRLLRLLETQHGLRLRVMADIVAGASAGGINSVLLAQAIHSGQSLDPLTELWLDRADVDVLLDPEAHQTIARAAKFWAAPLVNYLLKRPGDAVTASVAPETRGEVREKLSRLVRSRWFEPPFSGIGFSRLLNEALGAMAQSPDGDPLLPPGHPLDLFVTATDFAGHLEALRLHSPEQVLESEHRLTIGFRKQTPSAAGGELASPLELVFAARATASFPGAFPPLQVGEIDEMAAETGMKWPGRAHFLRRVMPEHSQRGDVDNVALIDGSVLVNAPFADAVSVLRDRPAHREVDRRFVYVDPTPDRKLESQEGVPSPGFFSVIFGSLSAIPREQPIRDNLEAIERQSGEMATMRAIIAALRPEVDEAVEKLFGRTFFFDRPNPKRLAAWRAKAQAAAWGQAGFAYHGYAQVKFTAVVNLLAKAVFDAAPKLGLGSPEPIARRLSSYLAANGLDRMSALRGGASSEAVAFFRAHDLAYRVRRLRLLARRVTQEWESDSSVTEDARDAARGTIHAALALYLDEEPTASLGEAFAEVAAEVFTDPAKVLDYIAVARALAERDAQVDAMLSEAMAAMPATLRRHMLLSYLGFPFYDTVSLPLLRGEGLTEYDPIKVDRISPDDCHAIRSGGAHETLRGTEFYNFGAFFSRAYRENDYLWGRLHGAERMIDLIASTQHDNAVDPRVLAGFKRDAFLAILDEEDGKLAADPDLVAGIRREVLAMPFDG
jgi:patatin-related protein